VCGSKNRAKPEIEHGHETGEILRLGLALLRDNLDENG
jgi:hypothetical protein